MIRYTVKPVAPAQHRFQVTVTLDAVGTAVTWRLPAWVPGSYMIRDFARNVVDIVATVDGQPLPLAKLDKQTWQTAAPANPAEVTLTLEFHAHDNSVRAAFLDNRYGFLDGASLLPEPVGHGHENCTLTLHAADTKPDWTLATGLDRLKVDRHGFGSYQAENYASLIDHPVLMGELEMADFEVQGVRHRIVLQGQQRADMARLCRDVQAICTAQARLFGELPLTDYVFLTRATESEYGGLEHRNSCALVCGRDTLPARHEPAGQVREGYRTLLGLFSHEYFHLWNVKRIKPAAFVPYDLTREVHTELLWAFEGITSYYDDLMLVRSGVITPASYLESLGQTLTRVARGRGRLKQSVAASSFDAWTRFYKQDESAPNVLVSYYTKGAWVALALDLTLRSETGGRKSLDDVMRLLWQRYGRNANTPAETGVPENGIEEAVAEVAGKPLADFFRRHVHGTEDPELAPLLAALGIELHWRAQSGHDDKGGRDAPPRLSLGATLAPASHGAALKVLYGQGIAMQAGLAAGDVLVAFDGLKVTAANLDGLLGRYAPGDRVRLHVFRGDELMTFDVTLAPSAAEFAWLAIGTAGLTPAGRDWLQVAQ